VRHISEGSLSAETYARALLAQAERLSFLDTIISIDSDAVLEAARLVDVSRRRGRRLGPLAGLPLLVKDNIDTKALPTTAGTPGLLSNRPGADAPLLHPCSGRERCCSPRPTCTSWHSGSRATITTSARCEIRTIRH